MVMELQTLVRINFSFFFTASHLSILVAGAPGNSGSGAIFVLYLTSSGAISSFASIDSLDDIPDSPAVSGLQIISYFYFININVI